MKKMEKTKWFRQTLAMQIWKGLWTDQTWLWNPRTITSWLHYQLILFLLKDLAGRWWFPPKVSEACSPLSPVEERQMMGVSFLGFLDFWRLISSAYRWRVLFGNRQLYESTKWPFLGMFSFCGRAIFWEVGLWNITEWAYGGVIDYEHEYSFIILHNSLIMNFMLIIDSLECSFSCWIYLFYFAGWAEILNNCFYFPPRVWKVCSLGMLLTLLLALQIFHPYSLCEETKPWMPKHTVYIVCIAFWFTGMQFFLFNLSFSVLIDKLRC